MSELFAARAQMGSSLAFHIVFAALGMGMPLAMVTAEGLWLRTGNDVYRQLARTWSQAFGVLFAVGAVSGTILSFELGLLWPRFMDFAGGIIGMPFSLEASRSSSRRSSSGSTSTAGSASRRAGTG